MCNIIVIAGSVQIDSGKDKKIDTLSLDLGEPLKGILFEFTLQIKIQMICNV